MAFFQKKYIKAPICCLLAASLLLQFWPSPKPAQAGFWDIVKKLISGIKIPNEVALNEDGWLTLRLGKDDLVKLICADCVEEDKDGDCIKCRNPISTLSIGKSEEEELTPQDIIEAEIPEECELRILYPKDKLPSPEERIAHRKACTSFIRLQRSAAQEAYLAKKIYQKTNPFSECLFLRNCKSDCVLRFGEIRYVITLMDIAQFLLPTGWLTAVSKIINILGMIQEVKNVYNMAKGLLKDAINLVNTVLGTFNHLVNLFDALKNLGGSLSGALGVGAVVAGATIGLPGGPAQWAVAGGVAVGVGYKQVKKGFNSMKELLGRFADNLLQYTQAKAEANSMLLGIRQDLVNIKEGGGEACRWAQRQSDCASGESFRAPTNECCSGIMGMKQEPELAFLFDKDNPKREDLENIVVGYQTSFNNILSLLNKVLLPGQFIEGPITNIVEGMYKSEGSGWGDFVQDYPAYQATRYHLDHLPNLTIYDTALGTSTRNRVFEDDSFCYFPQKFPECAGNCKYIYRLEGGDRIVPWETKCPSGTAMSDWEKKVLNVTDPQFVKNVLDHEKGLKWTGGGKYQQGELNSSKEQWRVGFWESLARLLFGDEWVDALTHSPYIDTLTQKEYPKMEDRHKRVMERCIKNYPFLDILRNMEGGGYKEDGARSAAHTIIDGQYELARRKNGWFKTVLNKCDSDALGNKTWVQTFKDIFSQTDTLKGYLERTDPKYINDYIIPSMDCYGGEERCHLDYKNDVWRTYWEGLARHLVSPDWVKIQIEGTGKESVSPSCVQNCLNAECGWDNPTQECLNENVGQCNSSCVQTAGPVLKMKERHKEMVKQCVSRDPLLQYVAALQYGNPYNFGDEVKIELPGDHFDGIQERNSGWINKHDPDCKDRCLKEDTKGNTTYVDRAEFSNCIWDKCGCDYPDLESLCNPLDCPLNHYDECTKEATETQTPEGRCKKKCEPSTNPNDWGTAYFVKDRIGEYINARQDKDVWDAPPEEIYQNTILHISRVLEDITTFGFQEDYLEGRWTEQPRDQQPERERRYHKYWQSQLWCSDGSGAGEWMDRFNTSYPPIAEDYDWDGRVNGVISSAEQLKMMDEALSFGLTPEDPLILYKLEKTEKDLADAINQSYFSGYREGQWVQDGLLWDFVQEINKEYYADENCSKYNFYNNCYLSWEFYKDNPDGCQWWEDSQVTRRCTSENDCLAKAQAAKPNCDYRQTQYQKAQNLLYGEEFSPEWQGCLKYTFYNDCFNRYKWVREYKESLEDRDEAVPDWLEQMLQIDCKNEDKGWVCSNERDCQQKQEAAWPTCKQAVDNPQLYRSSFNEWRLRFGGTEEERKDKWVTQLQEDIKTLFRALVIIWDYDLNAKDGAGLFYLKEELEKLNSPWEKEQLFDNQWSGIKPLWDRIDKEKTTDAVVAEGYVASILSTKKVSERLIEKTKTLEEQLYHKVSIYDLDSGQQREVSFLLAPAETLKKPINEIETNSEAAKQAREKFINLLDEKFEPARLDMEETIKTVKNKVGFYEPPDWLGPDDDCPGGAEDCPQKSGFLNHLRRFETEAIWRTFRDIFEVLSGMERLEESIFLLTDAVKAVDNVSSIKESVNNLKPQIRTETIKIDDGIIDDLEAKATGFIDKLKVWEDKEEEQNPKELEFFKGGAGGQEDGTQTFSKFAESLFDTPLAVLRDEFENIEENVGYIKSTVVQAQSQLSTFFYIPSQGGQADTARQQRYSNALNEISQQRMGNLQTKVFGNQDLADVCTFLFPLLGQSPAETAEICLPKDQGGEIDELLFSPDYEETRQQCDQLLTTIPRDISPAEVASELAFYEHQYFDVNHCPENPTAANLQSLPLGVREYCKQTWPTIEALRAQVNSNAEEGLLVLCNELEFQKNLRRECREFETAQKAVQNKCGDLADSKDRATCQTKKSQLKQRFCQSQGGKLDCQKYAGGWLSDRFPDITKTDASLTEAWDKVKEICQKVNDIRTPLEEVMKVFSVLMGIRSGTLAYGGIKDSMTDAKQLYTNIQKLVRMIKQLPESLSQAWNKENKATGKGGLKITPLKCIAKPAVSYVDNKEKTGPEGGPVCPDVSNLFSQLQGQFANIRKHLREIDIARRTEKSVNVELWGNKYIHLADFYPVVEYESVNNLYKRAEELKEEAQYVWALATAIDYASKECTCGQSFCKLPICISGLPLTLSPLSDPYCSLVWLLRIPMKDMAEHFEKQLQTPLE